MHGNSVNEHGGADRLLPVIIALWALLVSFSLLLLLLCICVSSEGSYQSSAIDGTYFARVDCCCQLLLYE